MWTWEKLVEGGSRNLAGLGVRCKNFAPNWLVRTGKGYRGRHTWRQLTPKSSAGTLGFSITADLTPRLRCEIKNVLRLLPKFSLNFWYSLGDNWRCASRRKSCQPEPVMEDSIPDPSRTRFLVFVTFSDHKLNSRVAYPNRSKRPKSFSLKRIGIWSSAKDEFDPMDAAFTTQ